jgi:hypothetical protein
MNVGQRDETTRAWAYAKISNACKQNPANTDEHEFKVKTKQAYLSR